MRPAEFSTDNLTTLLRRQTIATLPELMAALGTEAKRTVFRKLRTLAYRSSYSHRGRYYTLDELTHFDELGLWSYQDVWFSSHDTLLSTAWLRRTPAILSTNWTTCSDVLRKLVLDVRLTREQLTGCIVPLRRGVQLRRRRAMLAEPGMVPRLQTCLNSERRWCCLSAYSTSSSAVSMRGLMKNGRGGDQRMADLIGLDNHRPRTALAQDVALDRVRRAGGGRPSVEKKRRKSSQIQALMAHETAGDPIWTRRTTERIATELRALIEICSQRCPATQTNTFRFGSTTSSVVAGRHTPTATPRSPHCANVFISPDAFKNPGAKWDREPRWTSDLMPAPRMASVANLGRCSYLPRHPRVRRRLCRDVWRTEGCQPRQAPGDPPDGWPTVCRAWKFGLQHQVIGMDA